MKIVGNTVGTTMPKPNLMQTDPSKGDYVKGKEEFAEQVGSGGNVDLTGYATEEFVREGFQPKGDYLTEVPEGYARDEDIPTKPEDIGAQPVGDYLTEVPSGYATEEFVKNKIAEAELGGEEVDLSGYAQKSELPTKVSQLENDKKYLTSYTETDPTVPSWAKQSQKPSYTASEVGALPNTTKIPSKTSDLANDSGFITGYTETDPTVPAWAKATTKPSYSKSEVGLGNVDNVKQYSASNPPPYPVTSVNGKTGAVTLDAAAVSARPSTWMPSAADVGALPASTTIPSKTSQLTNDSGYIKGYTETDPTVPSWAKASSKPSYSKSEVGLGNVDNVKQYSASNPPPYPVTSVNGETGAVTVSVPTKVSQLQNDAGFLTEISKEEIVQQVITALGTPVFGRVDSDNNIILTGELADGTYTLKYEDADGDTVDIGTLDVGVGRPIGVNLIPLSINADGTPFVGTNGESGYKSGYRLNSAGAEAALDGMYSTGFMPIETGDTISVNKMCWTANTSTYNYRTYIHLYDESFALIGSAAADKFKASAPTVEGVVSGGVFTAYDAGDGQANYNHLTRFTIDAAGAKYMRMCSYLVSASSVVMISES